MFNPVSKFLKFLTSVLPSYGAFAALKRQAILVERLYPQYVTWNQKTWKPEATPKIKLVPWYLLTLLVTSITLHLIYSAVKEITAHSKDPDLGLVEAFILVFFICANVISTAAFYIFIFKVQEICFVLGNMQVLKKVVADEEVADDPSNLGGLFLNAMVTGPILATLTVSSLPILLPSIDPSYKWFRNISWIPPVFKILLRVIILFVQVGHGSEQLFSLIIYVVNCALPFHACLSWMTRPKLFQGRKQLGAPLPPATKLDLGKLCVTSNIFVKMGRAARFLDYYSKYRQLQIVMTVANQIFGSIVPITMLLGLVLACVTGYMVIKLSGEIPLPLIFLSAFLLIMILCAAHGITPLAANATSRSEIVVRFWKLQNLSAHRKRQLRSLRVLVFQIGPYFKIKNSTRGTFLSLILYYTCTLVMSF